MAFYRSGNQSQFGYDTNPGTNPFGPEPIIAGRAPTTADTCELGSIWIDTSANTFYVLVNAGAGGSVWANTTAGATTLAALTVDPGNATVTAGDLTVSAGDAIIFGSINAGGTLSAIGNLSTSSDLAVAGTSTLGDVNITGDLAIVGGFSITDTNPIVLTSTDNAPGAISLITNGGVAETLALTAVQGTSTSAVNIVASVGGVTLQAGLAGADSISLLATDAAGGVEVTYGTGGMAITGLDGSFVVETGTGDIDIGVDAFQHDIAIGNSTGTTSVDIEAGSGGLNIATAAVAQDVTIGNVTGTSSVNINTGSAGCTITTTDAIFDVVTGAGAINIGADAAAKTVTIGNATAAAAVAIDSGTGGITLTSTDFITETAGAAFTVDAVGNLDLNSSAGIINIGNDAVAQNINIGIGAAARIVTIGNVSGASSVVLNSGTAGVTINTTGAGDFAVSSADAVTIDSAGALELNSSAGAITIGGDAVAQSIGIGTGASARPITIGNVTTTTGVTINSGTSGITANTTGTGDFTVNSADKITLDSAGTIDINSSAAAINIGDDAIAQGINIGTGASVRPIIIGNVTGTTKVTLNSGTNGVEVNTTGAGSLVVNSANAVTIDAAGAIDINSSAAGIDIGTDAVSQNISIGTDGDRVCSFGSAVGASETKINAGATGVVINAPFISLPGPVFIYTGAGVPANALAVQVGDLYIRTDAGAANRRMYIATAAATWTNVSCAA